MPLMSCPATPEGSIHSHDCDHNADYNFIMQLAKDLGGDAQKVVSDIYSPPRVTAAAARLKHFGIAPGFAMDLRTNDENGVPWNFDLADRRDAARRKVVAERPMFLIGSPMCTRFCGWQHLNDPKRDPETVRREHVQAVLHLSFVCELYKLQNDAGRYFFHEHPHSASSWNEDVVKEVLDIDGVETVRADRCQYGQESEGEPVRNATRFMSNSPEILKKLGARCTGRNGQCSRHRGGVHRHAEGSVTESTAEFPFPLCRAILQGCRRQLIVDGRLTLGVVGIQRPEESMEVHQLEKACTKALNMVIEINEVKGDEAFYDAITGQRLRADLVRAARREELEYFVSKRVWLKVPEGKPWRSRENPLLVSSG
jgi:hypothetical protein